ncbi:MAG TPA: ABC transporter permease [Nitrolancea sp.]|nr:ABC transporter permease [Nitrolancea sp.]
MLGLIVRRLFWIVPVLVTVAVVTFLLMHQAPGGPWDSAKPLPETTRRALDATFGLDKPVWFNTEEFQASRARGEGNPLQLAGALLDSQFFTYLGNAARGDLGPTYSSQGTETVQSVLVERIPVSAKLGLVGIISALLFGLPLGIISALRQDSWIDHASRALATTGIAIPNFIIGVLAIIFLSTRFGIKPIRSPEDWDGLSAAYLIPGIILGLGLLAYVTRLTRAGMLEINPQDFIRAARGRGLPETTIVLRHMLRNALIPVVTILGPAVVDLFVGSFIIESIFNVPGIGRTFVTAISSRDYSLIMGITLFYAFLVAMANLVVDLGYGFLDPRLRSH